MRALALVSVSLFACLATGSASVAEPAAPRPGALPVSAGLRPLDALMASLPIPSGYTRVGTSDVAVDRQSMLLIRYERADDRNSDLGGEHVSVLVDRWGRLKGFARMDLALREGELPPRDEAEAIARSFLARHAPDIAPAALVVAAVTPHERMLTADDEQVALGGMKVKMRNASDGRWLWVTVGADRHVMAFERDIVWSAEDGSLRSERWLDDNWLGRAIERLGGRGA